MELTSAIAIPFALLAGLFSFVSPCVLPLVPAYIGYLTGQAANTNANQLALAEGGTTETAVPSRWIVFSHGLFFVIGFSIIFILFGISVGAIGNLRLGLVRSREYITLAGGILVIILGLHTMDVIRIPFLYADTRNQKPPKHELGFAGSFLMGVTFSVGWSPCIGPILGGILALGSTQGSIGRAALLLAVYSVGLGIPFLLAAFAMERFSGVMNAMKKYMQPIKILSGLMLIAIGILLATNMLTPIFARFANSGPSIFLEEMLLRLAGGG
jgi:cytochrome c-type biogenesis protein